ncbi:MAG: DUF362 domain-containing protein [Anaerolineales bacterium]|nr:DUF362 domain-containing protein [Anaerolineales bacterium]
MKENIFTNEGKALVSKLRCDGDLGQGIGQAVAAIGGFERLVEPGDTILVKPNFNTADPPPASSDPQFVKAVIELLYEHGAGKVIVGESSMLRLSTRDTLRQTGMLQAAEEAGAEVVFFDEGEWVTAEIGGRYLKKVALAKAGLEAEKIVYVCCLKTHRYADFTMSLKLAMGFVRRRDRVEMHLRRLREKLAELNLVIALHLIIMDGRRCFISGGPSAGELREPNLILASGDRIAIDVEALKVIQSYPGHSLKKSPWELTMIRRAVELGLGAASEAEYEVVDESTAVKYPKGG